MSQSLSTRTVEFASGTTGSMPFNLESSNSYYYPLVQMVPGELGGMSVHHLLGAATTNATSVKTSAGMVYGFSLFSLDTVPVYVTFYNKASAPTVDTDTIFMKFGITYSGTAANGSATPGVWNFPLGITFSTGIAFALHKGISTSSALDATEVLFTMWYK